MISLTSPVRTGAHGWSAGGKLALLCAATLGLFSLDEPASLAAAALATCGIYALGGAVFARDGLGRVARLWPFVAILVIWHLLLDDPALGIAISLRMLVAVALANLVTMTTTLSEMMAVVQAMVRPLARFGLNPRALGLGVAMVVRFVPVLADKGAALSEAWRARARGRRAGWRIVVPMAVLALDDAEQVAEALRARGGIAGQGPAQRRD